METKISIKTLIVVGPRLVPGPRRVWPGSLMMFFSSPSFPWTCGTRRHQGGNLSTASRGKVSVVAPTGVGGGMRTREGREESNVLQIKGFCSITQVRGKSEWV